MKTYNKNNIPLARQLRKNQTKWENDLWYKFLREYPVRFQRQKAIGNYIADFYCAKARLVIELDGYYHTTDSRYSEDKARTDILERMGLTVVRFNNSDIEDDFQKICKQIDSIVKKAGSKQ